ncbi:MAG: hypothetical protein ACRDGA_07940 [Bacteroidota bacterium]
MKRIDWTSHAKQKLEILKQYGYILRKEEVEEAITFASKKYEAKSGRKAIHKVLGDKHLLRVIVEETKDRILV